MIYAISDLHLSLRGDKPMDIFGNNWAGYVEKIKENWNNVVKDDDIVLLSGDLSWALKLEDAIDDMKEFLGSLPGKKVIIRGNHDYWWNSYAKLNEAIPPNIYAIQNNCIRFDNVLICGTRGWTIPVDSSSDEDKKIYARELIRLELALQSMQSKRKEEDKVIVMLHYPPIGLKIEETGFTALIKKFNVDSVVYGHLHGKDSCVRPLIKFEGISYYLTSCDLVDHKLIPIMNNK